MLSHLHKPARGGHSHIDAVVMALTVLLTLYSKEGVESLCILLYIIGSRAKCGGGQTVNE